MKSFGNVYRYWVVLIVIISVTPLLDAQVRYKHVPRVKVDKKLTEQSTVSEYKILTTTTAEFINIEENTPVITENAINIENTTVVSNTDEVVVICNKTQSEWQGRTDKPVIDHYKVVSRKKNADRDVFTNKIKKNSKLMEVKEVKKTTALELWLIIFIICLALGTIFLIISLVMLFSVGYSVLSIYYIFVIIAVAFLLAANILLPLGLKGKLTKKTD